MYSERNVHKCLNLVHKAPIIVTDIPLHQFSSLHNWVYSLLQRVLGSLEIPTPNQEPSGTL